jgi:hypothetical protein
MDRQIVYPGAIPLEVDLLNSEKNAMIGLSKLAAGVLGTSTMVNGFAVTPTSPASLQVYCAPGEIYAMANIDGTAYSSLAADTTHSILKQGISLDQVTLSCPAPASAGQSINYLIEVGYQDVDSGATVLPYYNASNPSQAYSGPANAETAQNTVRKGAVSIIAKAGVAATTGTQTTPSADAGYTGVYVVTVANGQTQINAGNIVAVSNAPFLPYNLTSLSNGFGSSIAANGYQKLPSGLIIQWGLSAATGSVAGNSTGSSTFTYPITFPGVVYAVLATLRDSLFGLGGTVYPAAGAGLSSAVLNFWNAPGNGTWNNAAAFCIAIGR